MFITNLILLAMAIIQFALLAIVAFVFKDKFNQEFYDFLNHFIDVAWNNFKLIALFYFGVHMLIYGDNPIDQVNKASDKSYNLFQKITNFIKKSIKKEH